MKKILAVVLGAAFVGSGGLAWAHHSGAMFDNAKQIKVTGTIKEFQFTNPHAWLIVTVRNGAGKPTDWGFEFAGGPSSLLRVGIKKSTLVPGEQVTVTGNPLRDGRPGANMVLIQKANGTVINPRGNQPPPARPN